MKPSDLQREKLVEQKALTEENGCTIFALAGAIAILAPDISEIDLTRTMSDLISTPLETTPLYQIAQEHQLPAPLLLDVGGVTAIKWINEGHGDALMSFLNEFLASKRLPIKAKYLYREADDSKKLLRLLKNKNVLLLSCSLFTDNEWDGNHHVALGLIDNQFGIIDINSPLAIVDEKILSALMDDEEYRVDYIGDEQLNINRDPIIILESL